MSTRHIYIFAWTPRCTVRLSMGTFFPNPTILPVSQRVFDWNRLLLPGSDQCINRCFGCYFSPNPHLALESFHNTNIPTVPLNPHPQAPKKKQYNKETIKVFILDVVKSTWCLCILLHALLCIGKHIYIIELHY